MSYKVNKGKCIGCGLCVSLCPEVFELGEDSKSEIKKEADLEKNKERIKEVIQSCPVGAIESKE